ncbi:MAG: SDR family oxidoreductase, partial [Pseudomonadota bacterium]
ELKQIGGLYKSAPLLAVLFLIPAFSLAGFPPLSGFWAKFILVKAALEASVRYIAAELGPKDIRVNALSPGPIRTRAASGLENVGGLVRNAEQQSPLPRLATIEEIGAYASFLVCDEARSVTGSVAYIDNGYNIMGGAAGD